MIWLAMSDNNAIRSYAFDCQAEESVLGEVVQEEEGSM